MLCNNSREVNNADSSVTLISRTHRQKVVVANKSTDETSIQSKSADITKKLNASASALINRGGGDCAANDILNRDFPKMKLNNGEAMIVLLCEKNSHPFETRLIPLMPHTQCTVGRISSKCRPSESNAYFDCKVLSRNQAMIWYDDEGKFWIKDTQSSNGTYLNGSKLIDEAIQMHSGDVIQLGVNVYENKCSEVHNCIVASVQLYLPRITTAEEGTNEDHVEITSSCSKSLTQQLPPIDDVSEQHDLCETSRTTVESDSSGRSLKLSTVNHTGDGTRRIAINFKDDKTDKPIKLELHSIQSFIEAIRNSKLDAWESISKEDSYLHHIYNLHNKINILKRGMSDDELKNEKQQWENEKYLFKRTAKDAIRRIALECKEIMLKVEQTDSKFKILENECDVLRDQIDSKDQSINDFSCLLRHIEMDYDEYKTEMQAKNAKQNITLEKKLEDLMCQIQKLEIERENLSKRFLELAEYDKEKFDSNCDIEEAEAQSGENSTRRLVQMMRKFQQLEKIFKDLEKKDNEELFQLDNYQMSYAESANFLKFKKTYVELLVQYKELYILLTSEEHLKAGDSEVEFVKVEFAKSIKIPRNKSTTEASEQTTTDLDNYEVELEELQAQLTERELETEHLYDMLESESDMYRNKLSELEQEHANLLAQQEEIKAQKSQTQCEELVADDAEKIIDKDNEDVLSNLKAAFSVALKEKKAQLAETEKQLAVFKERLIESQQETLILETEIAELAEKQQQQQQQQQQHQEHGKVLPIIVPIFLGLIGMCIYLVISLFS